MAIDPNQKADAAIKYARQAEKLSLDSQDASVQNVSPALAVEAKFITPLDNVIETASGERLPGVPPDEAVRFNELKHEMEGVTSPAEASRNAAQNARSSTDEVTQHLKSPSRLKKRSQNLGTEMPPSRTHPLFPPLPLYGPPTFMRNVQCMAFRITSFFLSLGFLLVIVLGSAFTSVPLILKYIWLRMTFRDPDARRPLYEEEKKRQASRARARKAWSEKKEKDETTKSDHNSRLDQEELGEEKTEEYEPTEGGPDPMVCDAAYYARRVGLDMEEFKVQTEDGFIIRLWHVYNPKEYSPANEDGRSPHAPVVFPDGHVESGRKEGASARQYSDGDRRYPVLLIHGLLQSAGAYCVNDDHSLAFYLAKSGYDVWLGNNRCGFHPEHTMLKYTDPRMWAWNIRQMGVMDLPALVSRVLSETGFEKLGLICHSQGTTQTFVALAKEQRPELGEKISVFCALAPAVYAGPLIGKMYFKFMRIISPAMFRVFFGIHAFIPFMMLMHRTLPSSIYGFLGYRVFSFLFNWSDARWDREIRSRLFQFSPVYVSSESMRWWLGRECFARQKCILATRDQQREDDNASILAAAGNAEEILAAEPDFEDESDLDQRVRESTGFDGNRSITNDDERGRDEKRSLKQRDQRNGATTDHTDTPSPDHSSPDQSTANLHGKHAWYSSQCPPFALWVAGHDDLVDGRKLLQRFKRGREPHVRLVHSKVIPEYEHLDVIWAVDAIEQVGTEVREVVWRSVSGSERKRCRVPRGCEDLREEVFFG